MADDNIESLRGAQDKAQDFGVVSSGVLTLDIPDIDLNRVLDMKIRESEKYYDTVLNLTERRKRNNDYWQGKQIDKKMLYDWQVPYIDNVIYRNIETIIPIAVSRVPDIFVLPGNDEPVKIKRAADTQKVLDAKIKSRYIRDVLRTAARNLLLDLVFIIKCRWDRNSQKPVFEPVKASKVILDHTAVPGSFGMSSEAFDFIGEWIEEPLKVVIAKFPNKKQELFSRIEGGIARGTERQLANKIRYQEIWFTWYDEKGFPMEGVCWRFKDLILDKIKNPYWDWEGQEQPTGEVNPFTGEAITQTRQFNHFDRPLKPYIIRNYQNTGNSGPMDSTSPVEQVIPLQDVINKRGRQITELADKANPKKIFSTDFMTKEQVADVTDDPGESIVGSGSVRDGFNYVPGIPPNPTLYQDLLSNRLEADNILGAHSTTRGERVPQESGVARQITREGDFGRIDDFVMTVIEPAADEIANWIIHFMKVFGTEKDFTQVLGEVGQTEFIEFDRDSLDDGLNITVKASTVDKTERRAVATQLAASGSIDPLSLFEDLGAQNPTERARRMMAFKGDPTGATYMELILKKPQESQTLLNVAGAAQGTPPGAPAAPPTGAGITAPPVQEGGM